MLRIRLLGEVKIENENEDLTGRLSNKSVALIALLILREGRRCSRRRLISYLWPESTESAAKYNLRYNLWQLKKVFGAENPEDGFLIITKEECRINENFPYQCDLRRILDADIEETEDVAELEDLGALFCGDFFEDWYFDGCDELEEMIILSRYNLENKKLSLFRKLVSLYFRENETKKCMKALEICEEMDPYDEGNAKIRMELLIRAENYSEADRYYQRFCRRLIRDIGVEPSAGLRALAGTIRGKEEPERDALFIEAAGLESVEFYMLSEILRELMKLPQFRIEEYLDAEQIADLACIQYRLGSACPSHPARIAGSFVALLCGVCADGRQVEVKLKEGTSCDRASKEVLRLVRAECGDRLTLR